MPYDSTQGQECLSHEVAYLCSAFLHKLSDDLLAKSESCVVAGQHGEAATAGSTDRVPDGEPQPLASSSGRPGSEALSGPPQIGIIMGSDSDLKTMVAAEEVTNCSCTANSDAFAAHARARIHSLHAYLHCVCVIYFVYEICHGVHAMQAMSVTSIAYCSKAHCS